MEHIDRDSMEHALDVQPIRGKRELKERGLGREELDTVFGVCFDDKNAAAGARDACILGLLYGTGLRRTEVVILDIEDLDFGTGSLKVIGKGDNERTVYLPRGTLQLAESWIAHRGTLESGPLLWHVARTGETRPRRISAESVYRIVLKRHRISGVDRFTPHDLRRSYISDLLDDGVDSVVAARQVGHANVQATARYDRRSERSQQEAARQLGVPCDGLTEL